MAVRQYVLLPSSSVTFAVKFPPCMQNKLVCWWRETTWDNAKTPGFRDALFESITTQVSRRLRSRLIKETAMRERRNKRAKWGRARIPPGKTRVVFTYQSRRQISNAWRNLKNTHGQKILCRKWIAQGWAPGVALKENYSSDNHQINDIYRKQEGSSALMCKHEDSDVYQEVEFPKNTNISNIYDDLCIVWWCRYRVTCVKLKDNDISMLQGVSGMNLVSSLGNVGNVFARVLRDLRICLLLPRSSRSYGVCICFKYETSPGRMREREGKGEGKGSSELFKPPKLRPVATPLAARSRPEKTW